MKLKKTLILTVILSLISITVWEFYWRSQGYTADLDDDKYLWAKARHKLEKATEDDVVIIGSSRVLFDLQLDVWESETGIKPIQLASAGSIPLPVFNDIVERTDFKGTLVVGVTPPLFFSTTYPGTFFWKRADSRINFYKNRTYAQRLNYSLAVPLQNTFAFLSNDEEEWYDDINLKALLRRVSLPQRTEKPLEPPFYRFQDINIDRNVRMKGRMVTDTAFANSVKNVWEFMVSGDRPPPDKESTINYFLEDLKKFTARGGKIILVRAPSDGMFRDLENKGMSRNEFWDELVEKAGVPAYHFEDYEGLNQFILPEWSHLSAEDADLFTKRLVKILLEDNVIPTQKTN